MHVFCLQMANIAVALRRVVRQQGAVLPNQRIFDMVAAGEAGAGMSTAAARQMMNRERRRHVPALPATPAQAAVAIAESLPLRRHLAFSVDVGGEVRSADSLRQTLP